MTPFRWQKKTLDSLEKRERETGDSLALFILKITLSAGRPPICGVLQETKLSLRGGLLFS